jgi:hypothetical protein
MKYPYKKLFILIILFFILPILKLNEISAADFSKTVKFFILQDNGTINDGIETSQPFTISIAEDNPQIISAYIQIKGSAKSPAPTNGIVNVKLDSNPYNSYNLDVSTKPQKFTINHDITSIVFADFPGVPGNKNYILYVRNDNFDTTNLNAKLILTYKYTKNTGNLPVSGFVISSAYDTLIVQGAGFNSIMWNGNLNGGKVRLQLATSDSALGPWNFKGPDCNSSAYYENDANVPNKIKCLDHNNQRYFRYKIILCSNNCVGAGSSNPNVNSVIVNWSP